MRGLPKVLAILAVAGSCPVGAATPGSGTVSDSNPSVSFSTTATQANNTFNPPTCTTAATRQCDNFALSLLLPAGYVGTHPDGVVTITTAWTNAGDDFDLYLQDASGAYLKMVSNTGAGPETVTLPLREVPETNGTPISYNVRVVLFAKGSGAGSGTATTTIRLTPGAASPAPPADPCTPPGKTVLTDRSGDVVPPPARSAEPGWDLLSVAVGEPYSVAPARLAFTLKTAGLSTLPAGTRWTLQFRDPANAGRWVDMKNDPATGLSFNYGTFTATLNAATGVYSYGAPSTVVGPAEAISNYNADGTITIVVPRSAVGNPSIGATLRGFLVRVRVDETPAGFFGADSMTDSLATFAGSYTLVGNNPFCRPNTAPIVDTFGAAPSTGLAPLSVTLSATAHDDDTAGPDPADTIASYTFEFGDGSPAETVNVSSPGTSGSTAHEYTTPPETCSIYTAGVTVTDNRGKPSEGGLTVPVNVRVPNRAPVAALSAAPNPGEAPETVTLDAGASADPDETPECGDRIASYTFDFGDGTPPVMQSVPSIDHEYATAGTYSASVQVTDSRGLSSSTPAEITIHPHVNRPPVADFTAEPLQGPAPLEVSFDAERSFDPDAAKYGDSVVRYDFDFGNGPEPFVTPEATHTFVEPGVYGVRLKVFDQNGAHSESDALLEVTVLNNPPVAALSVPDTAGKGRPVALDASGSSDPDGDGLVQYTFDPGDGSATVTQTGPVLQHVYRRSGSFPAKVSVKDSRGDESAQAPAQVTITNASPTAQLSVSPSSGPAPLQVDLDGSASVDPDPGDRVVSYRFVFDDGSAPVVRIGTGTVQHLYADHGEYQATLTVADDEGRESAPVILTITVGVVNRAPVARLAGDPLSGEAPVRTTLDASGSSDTDGDAIVEYIFDFGDGSAPVPQTGPARAHTYASPGRYEASVKVRDARGAMSANVAVLTVTVGTEPVQTAGAPPDDSRGPFGGALAVPGLLVILLAGLARGRRPARGPRD